MRQQAVIGSVALTLTATILTACGGGGGSSSSSGGYCLELKSDKQYFAAISGSNSDVSQLGTVFEKVHTLAADAPSSVSADWKSLDGAISTIEDALKAAGLKTSDLAGLSSGKLPPGVDPAQLQALVPKLQSLSSSDVTTAANNIAADAKKNCGVDLTAS
jgi:hypothetical protein